MIMAFLKLTADFIFKRLFVGSPELLIDLINAVLLQGETEIKDPITEIVILNPEITRETLDDKSSILDIKANDGHGNLYNIEIQAFPRSSFVKRALYYWARLYGSQLR